MKGNKMSAILAMLLVVSGALAVVPVICATGPHPVGACSASVTTPAYPTPAPTPSIRFLWGTNGTPGSTFTADAWVFNVSASDAMMAWSVGFFFNPTLLQVVSVTNGSVLNPYPAGNYTYIGGSINNTGGYVTVYTWSLFSTATPPTISAPNKWVDLLHVKFKVNPSLTTAQVAAVAGLPQNMMAFTTIPKDRRELILIDASSRDITPYGHITNGTITYITTVPPKYSGITRSTSYAGSTCTFSVTWQDITALSKYIFSFDNGVGYFTNDTAKAFTSNPQTVSSTKILIAKVGATVRYKWYANDTSNNWNSTAIQTFVTTGTAPTYSGITYSTAKAGAPCVFSITCSDRLGLSKYIFSFDNGVGLFTNSTAASFTSNPQTISVTKTLTATVGATIRFRWFFNDTLNLWNSTNVQSFVTTQVSVSISPTSAVLDLGQSQTFTSAVSGGSPPYSYHWYLNGTAVSGANSSTWLFKPLSSGTYSIYLQAKDTKGIIGESATATITVNSPPAIVVSPATVTLDIGEAWVFVASTFNGTPPYSSYQWYLDGSPIINATSETWTYTPLVLVNRTIYITAVDSKGVECTSNTVSVTVGAAMNPKISPSSVVMDIGMSQTYTVTVSGGTPPYSYKWYQWFPSGSQQFAGANKTTLYFTPSFAGFNLVYAEITDSLGIKVDIGAEATVNPPISASVSPSSATIDAGQSQTFAATTSGGEAPYSYQWILNGSVVSGATSSSWVFVPTAAGVYKISVNATDAFDISAISHNSLLTVNPPPTILVSPTSVALDVGESWTFRASIYNGTPPYSSYQWYIDGSPVVGATNSTWTYTPLSLVNRTIYVTASDYFNFEAISNKVSVIVSSAMNPKISPLSATLDFGQSQKYAVIVSGGTPPYSYQWYQWFPNGCKLFAGATNATFTFTPPTVGFNIIYVVITDSLGIKVDWGATAIVNPQPSAVVLPKSVIMDIGMSQLFTSTVINGTPPYGYQWFIDGSPVSGANNTAWTYTATTSSVGVHTAYLIVTDSVNFAVRSNNITITVNPQLVAYISPTSAAIDAGLPITLTSNITGGMPPYSYQWYVNVSPISGANKTSFTFESSSAGTYYVSLMVTDSFGFATSSNTATIVVNPLPTVTLSPASVSIPLGQNQTFTATITGGTPSYWYYWYVNGVQAAKTTASTFTFTPTTISTYYKLYVTIIDSYGLNATSNTAIINGHDVAVLGVIAVDNIGIGVPKTVFAQGWPIGINVTVADPGYYSETFKVTAYANTIAIAASNVTLSGGSKALITLAGTANLPYGNYTIGAYASPVPGELNMANNRVTTSTTIEVTIPGDLNGDGVVNLFDLGMITANWMQLVPPAPANADACAVGIINLIDLGAVTSHWMQTTP